MSVSNRMDAIVLENVSKKFRVHQQRNGTLKEKILYAGRAKYRDFVALSDVSLSIPKGATVGLLGTNGSGKSTLLKLMSRILYPDKGTVEVKGRVSSLLELGAGFHPDFTGKENIYMNGALLGLSRKELNFKMDEIIQFSELGDFIEEPIRTYSSGMYMRLAFSVAVAVDPDVLLIDEILAVGDAAFQAKCMSRLRKLQSQNKTIVLVTHDTTAVERFCDKAIWMHNSHVQKEGEPVTCIQAYLDTVFRDSHSGTSTMNFDRTVELDSQAVAQSSQYEDADMEPEYRYGNNLAQITKIELTSEKGKNIVTCGQKFAIDVSFFANNTIEDVLFGIGVFSDNGLLCYGTNTLIDRVGAKVICNGPGRFRVIIQEMNLLPGNYVLDVAIQGVNGQPYDYWRRAARFSVVSDRQEIGIVRLPHEWAITNQ